jgi:hypothetical protein
VWLAIALAGPGARAAEPSSADRTLAQGLFEQGRKLMAAKDYAAACPKLAESQRLDPSAGTMLNLAVCHEEAGRLATAWAEFNDAATAARQAHEDARVAFATKHASALEPRLAHVTIQVHGQADGLTATLDGAPLGVAAWATPLPVDVGTHRLAVSRAGGGSTWEKSIEVHADGDSVVVDVPADAGSKAAPATAESSASPAPAVSQGSARWPAYVAFGVAAVGLGVGVVYGVAALGEKSTLDGVAGCPSECPASQKSRIDSLHAEELWSDVGLGVALVGAGVGTWLLLRGGGGGGGETAGHAPVAVDVGPMGARVRGSF